VVVIVALSVSSDTGFRLAVALGRGPVDFKASSGVSIKALIEMQKVHSGSFWNGLKAQLPSYLRFDQSEEARYVGLEFRLSADGAPWSRSASGRGSGCGQHRHQAALPLGRRSPEGVGIDVEDRGARRRARSIPIIDPDLGFIDNLASVDSGIHALLCQDVATRGETLPHVFVAELMRGLAERPGEERRVVGEVFAAFERA
jgi:hypothetical protein